MTIVTSIYDAEQGEPMAKPSYRPWWWNPDLRRCTCATKPVLTHQHTGYSDSQFSRFRCATCGREWCEYLEG